MTAKFVPAVLGEETDRILKIRKMLAKAGSSIKPGKKFDIGMLSAVKAFQKKHGIKVSGKVDAATMNKLAEFDIPAKKTAAKKPATRRK